jgi:hypothetical protein
MALVTLLAIVPDCEKQMSPDVQGLLGKLSLRVL